MVCRNCGAEIKHGVMYCLECGSYIDETSSGISSTSKVSVTSTTVPEEVKEQPKPTRRKKKYKVKMSLKDWLIYGGLLLILIGSITVIIVTVVNGTKKQGLIEPVLPQTPLEVVREDQTYNLDNYSLVVSKDYNSDIQNDMLYVSDDVNFTLNFQVTDDDFDAYMKDRKTLEEELKINGYDVVKSYVKDNNSRIFIICQIRVNGINKYVYLSKITKKYSAMGIIEELTIDKWEDALPALDRIIETVVISDDNEVSSNDEIADSSSN